MGAPAPRLPAEDIREFSAELAKAERGEEREAVGFWDYDDLVALGLVQSRSGLFLLQRDWGFPRSTGLGGRRAGFHRPKVRAWVEEQLRQPPPPPGLRKPPNRPAGLPYPTKSKDTAPRPRGRPPRNSEHPEQPKPKVTVNEPPRKRGRPRKLT
jgi:predicted DNA-binding transcriptional regulator AlpA